MTEAAVPMVDVRHGLGVYCVADLTALQRAGMLRLLQTCYANVTQEQFARDLSEKEWAIVGVDGNDEVWLFTTLKRIQHDIDGHSVIAFYSGDSASRPDTRGGATSAGISLLIRKMFAEVAAGPDADYYWFMISSTYKSYRLLSRMFIDYAPSLERPLTERERQILGALSRIKRFEYDPKTSIVRFANASIPRDDNSTNGARRKNDPVARFFERSNAGAKRGDRLASLTKLSFDNLTPVGQRLVLDPELECE